MWVRGMQKRWRSWKEKVYEKEGKGEGDKWRKGEGGRESGKEGWREVLVGEEAASFQSFSRDFIR